MSITSDIRSYADSALEQGKQVLDQAQSQLTDVSTQANDFVVKLRGTATDNVASFTKTANGYVLDLRTQAEKAINLEAIKSAIEPYVAQAKGYSTTVTERAEDFYNSVKSDKRVAKLVTTVEGLTGVVVETVQDRVVKPVQSLTGRGAKPAVKKAAAKPATTKPAATKPVAKKAPARKAPAKKATVKA
jgi:hypothetical protein